MLLDRRYHFVLAKFGKDSVSNLAKLQDLIVDMFPSELQKNSPDKRGVPKDWADAEAVIKHLKLATSVERKELKKQDARSFLLQNMQLARSMFIETTPHGTHCVRLCQISEDWVTIMEPMDGKFWPWDWALFEREYRALVVLR
jgi:hypothetical protein